MHAAARELFNTHPYELVTIRDIAKAAHKSTGSFFSNYDTKAAVFLDLALKDLEQKMVLVEDVRKVEGDADKKLAFVFARLLDHEREQTVFMASRMGVALTWPLMEDTVLLWAILSAKELQLRNLIRSILNECVVAPEVGSRKALEELLWNAHQGDCMSLLSCEGESRNTMFVISSLIH